MCFTVVNVSDLSTLVNELLHPALEHQLGTKVPFQPCLAELRVIKGIDRVILIDQAPIGRTPRSNPATTLSIGYLLLIPGVSTGLILLAVPCSRLA